ncbi:MAG TPA: HAD family hydrolase [Hyphomicrobiaceae bacterium]|nr:HAD family hydrolase [Hyphomicrobiaceae bacterium]
MAIRGILFDKDGTLIDYERTWVPINRHVAAYAAGGDAKVAEALLRRFGHDPVTDAIEPGSVLAAGSVDDIASAFAGYLGLRTPPGLAAGIDRIYSAGGALHAVLIHGVRETLGQLKRRGFLLGVATNDSKGGLEASLRRSNILGDFHFTAGCDSGFGGKPGPGMARAFCEAVGIAPGQAAMVGDAVHDLAMGRAAGFALNIGVLSGTSGREDLEDFTDLILDSINDLPALAGFQSS